MYDISSVRGYFNKWLELDLIRGLTEENDPAPRQNMTSFLFKGDLYTYNIEHEIYCLIRDSNLKGNEHRRGLYPAIGDFYKNFPSFEKIENTQLFKYLVDRVGESQDTIIDKLRKKIDLSYNINKNGVLTPIYFNRFGHLVDGLHRLFVLQKLGYKYCLCRLI